MRCDFNKIFNLNFQRETKEQLQMRMKKLCSRAFFPGGITTRKRYFTPDELVDIYIKGNNLLYDQLEDKGFGDEDFNHSKTEWANAVLNSDKWFPAPQELQEKRNAFVVLIGMYLDTDPKLVRLGTAAFTNKEYFSSIDCFISDFEKLTMNFNLYLYYRFLAQIERLRQNHYDLARLFEQGRFLLMETYAEDKALYLERIQNAKNELKILVQQITVCNETARKIDERTDKNG